MPILDETQGVQGPIGAMAQREEPEDTPAFWTETLPAAFRTENIVGSILAARKVIKGRDGPTDPNFDPFSAIPEEFKTDAAEFAFADNQGEIDAIVEHKRQQINDRETLADSGTLGIVASIGAGVFDPINLIPVGGKAARVYQTGGSLLRAAGRTAVTTGASVAATEAVLQGTQTERTMEESAFAIAGGTLLGGIVGGGAVVLGDLARGRTLDDLSKAVEQDLTLPPAEKPDFVLPNQLDVPQEMLEQGADSFGAMRARMETLQDNTLKSAFGLEKISRNLNPTLRLLQSPSLSTRKVALKLLESPYRLNKNADGVASDVPVESKIKLWRGRVAKAIQSQDDAFLKYRFGKVNEDTTRLAGAKRGARMLQARASDAAGRNDGKLTYQQFKEAVSDAIRENGGKSDIPEVQQAAEAYQKEVFKPALNDLIESGIFKKDVDEEKARKYMMQMWNHDAISARRTELQSIISDELTKEQARMGALQKELSDLMAFRKTLDKKADSTKAKKVGKDKQVAKTEGKLDEARSMMLRELKDLFEMADDVDSAGKSTGETGKRLNAMRRRANELFDRKAGQEAEGDMMTQYIQSLKEKYKATGDDIAEVLEDILQKEEVKVNKKTTAQALNFRTDLTPDEINRRAFHIIDRITGLPGGRLPNDIDFDELSHIRAGGRRDGGYAATKRRQLDFLPYERIKGFLERDIDKVARIYNQGVATDVELTRAFGSVDMTRELDDVRNSYEAFYTKAGKDGKAQTLISKQRDADLADIQAVVDVLKGRFTQSPDGKSWEGVFRRGGRLLKNINYMSDMGGVLLSSIPDVGRVIAVNGFFKAFKRAIAPVLRNSKATQKALAEFKGAGIVAELVENRINALNIADIIEVPGSTMAERGVQKISRGFSALNGLTLWNQLNKEIVAMGYTTEVMEKTGKLISGKATKAEIEELAAGYIDKNLAARIQDQFKKHGELRDGIYIPHTEEWTDKEAATTLMASVVRQVDTSIISPGAGDLPLFMRSQLGGILTQYKSFLAAAHQDILIAGLQQRDVRFLSSVAFMVAGGMLAASIKAARAGKDTSEWTPQKWVMEGVDNSGILSLPFEMNNIVEKGTGFGLHRAIGGQPPSRFLSRNNADAMLGPSVGTIKDVMSVGGGMVGSLIGTEKEGWDKYTTKALRRLLPFQNLFYMRSVFDAMEHGLNSAVGAD